MGSWWKKGVFGCLAVLFLLGTAWSQGLGELLFFSNQGKVGNVLVSPLYDVRGDTAMQYFTITNVTERWVQGHIRFRSGKYSIEVLDFDIILSPNDVFTFWVLPDVGNGTPGIYSTDSNTINYSQALGLAPYTANAGKADATLTIPFSTLRLSQLNAGGVEEARWGYWEFIVEGATTESLDGSSLLGALEAVYDTSPTQFHDWTTDCSVDAPGVGHCFGYPVESVVGHGYFVDTSTDKGYGMNVESLNLWRFEDCDDVGTYIDCGYQPDKDNYPDIYSGLNGMILHEPIGVNTDPSNPFYRPDWTTTYGPTLAFGVAEGWFFVLEMQIAFKDFGWWWLFFGDGDVFSYLHAVSYMTHYISEPEYASATALLTFPTKHFHYYTGMMYDPYGSCKGSTYTHGYYDSTLSKWVCPDRTRDSVYNFDITKSDYDFKICLDYLAYDNAEHTFTPQGGVSPLRGGTQKCLPYEVNLEPIGPGAPVFDTKDYTEGTLYVWNFLLTEDYGCDFEEEITDLPIFPIGYVITGTVDGLEWFQFEWAKHLSMEELPQDG